jgi:hypothetical protein
MLSQNKPACKDAIAARLHNMKVIDRGNAGEYSKSSVAVPRQSRDRKGAVFKTFVVCTFLPRTLAALGRGSERKSVR